MSAAEHRALVNTMVVLIMDSGASHSRVMSQLTRSGPLMRTYPAARICSIRSISTSSHLSALADDHGSPRFAVTRVAGHILNLPDNQQAIAQHAAEDSVFLVQPVRRSAGYEKLHSMPSLSIAVVTEQSLSSLKHKRNACVPGCRWCWARCSPGQSGETHQTI